MGAIVEKSDTEQPAKTASAAQPNGVPGASAAVAPRKTTSPAPAQRRTIAAAPSAVSAGPFDGLYSGKICYGETVNLPARCYRAEGTILRQKITGQWAAPEAGNTMFMAGDVATSGNVKIGMHTEKPDGTVVIVIDLTGTVHDGLITASGTFRKGRTATLNWQKISREPN